MSFFSRLFRKAPAPAPAPTPRPASAAGAESARPRPDAAERARAAAAEEAALRAAIDAGDTRELARLVAAGTSTRLRQSAAQAIDDPEVLRQLIRDARGGNDRGVYKALTSRRELLLEQARSQEALRAEIAAAAGALERHSQSAYDTAFGATLEQAEHRWAAVAAQATPELRAQAEQWTARCRQTQAEHLREQAARATLEQAAAQAAAEAERLHQQQLQESVAAAAEQDRVADEQQRAVDATQQAEQQAGQHAVRQVADLIRKARAALGDGNTSRAASVRRAIDDSLAGAAPLPASLAGQIQLLDQQLAELRDWKNFSVAPKRAELIEAMESLIGAELAPPELADRIKGLQDEWRTLGKGAGTGLDADGQRFQQAARKAYQPCSEYFAAQALVRAENLQRRDAVLAGLQAFEAEHDWQQPDWRGVIKAINDARQQWRQHTPVDRVAARQQQDDFAAVTASLQGRLDAEHARNLQRKQSLIERAQALLGSDDARKAIDAVKALQQDWQSVGPVPREADQRLWAQFRQHCDGVFQKRQQELASYTAGLDDNRTQALALCEQAEALAALEGAALRQRAGELADLRNAFAALGELPRAEARELRSRFERGLQGCDAALARLRAHEAEQVWTALFEAADLVRAYRLGVVRELGAEQLATLKEAAESRMASAQRWPRHGLDALRQALARARVEDLAANETALKMLCVRAEILADRPTPADDQALRREIQLQRLVQNMGQGAKADAASLDGLAIEWVSVGPVDEAAYAPLLQRFRRCREPA